MNIRGGYGNEMEMQEENFFRYSPSGSSDIDSDIKELFKLFSMDHRP